MPVALRMRRRSDLLLALVDAAVAAGSCWLAYLLRFEGDLPLPEHFARLYLGTSIGTCLGYVVVNRVTGLYRRSVLRPATPLVEPAFRAAVTAAVLLLIVDYAALSGDLSRGWIGLLTFLLLLGTVGSRRALARARRALVPFGVGLERYAIVGEGAEARRLRADLTRAAGAPFEIVDMLAPSLGPEMLADLAAVQRLDGLIMVAGAEPERAGALAGRLAGFGIDVFLAPRIGDLDMRVASIATFHGVPLLRVAGVAPRRRAIRMPATGTATTRGVAILGTRGIPANYGGFETFAERLSQHLVEQGIPVTVYCRTHHASGAKDWQGVRLVTLPTIRHKYLDTVVHTLLSTLHLVLRTRIREVILCNAANAPALPLLRLFRRRVIMNVDGLEWRRGKWGVAGRSWYRLGEWLSVRFSAVLVTDANEVRTYYRVRHDTDSVMIPYGADLLPRNLPLPPELGLEPDGFALYVSRWEPENNPLMVARAHAAANVDMPLVMLGKAMYDDGLDTAVRAAAAPKALLPGPIFGEGYRSLQSNARCYIHATEVGGTHPALIEAMGAGNICLVLDTPENREVAGEGASYFADEEGLRALLERVEICDDHIIRRHATMSSRVAEYFAWSVVVRRYVSLLTSNP